MATYLNTGGAGSIGSHLVDDLTTTSRVLEKRFMDRLVKTGQGLMSLAVN